MKQILVYAMLVFTCVVLFPERLNAQTATGGKIICETPKRITPAENDSEIRLRLRGFDPVDKAKNLFDIAGPTDYDAPQLSTMFGGTSLVTGPPELTITNVYKARNTEVTAENDFEVTVMGIGTTSPIVAPKSNYDIGGGYNYAVLYANSTELTLKATAEDDVVMGYTLHFVDLAVNNAIIDAYNALQKDPKQKDEYLVAISCGFQIGTPINANFNVAIRDTGSFMDPRSPKDWWHAPTNDTCTNAGIGRVKIEPVCFEEVKYTDTSQGPFTITKLFSPEVQEFVAKILGTLHSGDRLLGIPNMVPYALRMAHYYRYATPLSIQKKTTTPKALKASAITSICLPTSEKDKQILPETGHLETAVAGQAESIKYTKTMDAQNSRGRVSDYNFKKIYIPQIVDNTQHPTCDEVGSGTDIPTRRSNDPKQVEFNNGALSVVFSALGQLGQAWNDVLARYQNNDCPEEGCQAPATIPGHVEIGTHIAYTNELEDFATGAFSAWKPMVIPLVKDSGNYTNQLLTSTIALLGGNISVPKLNYKAVAKTIEGQNFAKCATSPLSKQKELGADCSQFKPVDGASTSPTACTTEYFDQLKSGIEYSTRFGAEGITPAAGYTIPYRDPSYTLTPAMKEEAKRLMASNMMNGGTTGENNIDKYWDQINDLSKQYGWNPVFVATLWIEESAAGGHSNATHDLGCLYGWAGSNFTRPVSMPEVKESNVCDQMACLFSHPIKQSSDFSGFLCSYNSDAVSRAKYKCDASQGWAFPKTVQMIYNRLMGAGGGKQAL